MYIQSDKEHTQRSETMTKQARTIDTAEQAKIIRKALKASFVGTKFSVRISRYSGGSSINVTWTDGPTQKDVQTITSAYDGGGFDGMTDSSYNIQHWLWFDGCTVSLAYIGGYCGHDVETFDAPNADAELVSFMGSSVHASRKMSMAAAEQTVAVATKRYGWDAETTPEVRASGDHAYIHTNDVNIQRDAYQIYEAADLHTFATVAEAQEAADDAHEAEFVDWEAEHKANMELEAALEEKQAQTDQDTEENIIYAEELFAKPEWKFNSKPAQAAKPKSNDWAVWM
jgi:hypothetical protein